MRILLVEDDEVLSNLLLQSLTQQHYAVDRIDDGLMAWEYAQGAEYDLILIDVGLPKLDGISLCQRLRSEGNTTPILLMTAKDATSDRIKGLDAGADDYLIKPLDLGELQARVRALLRRGEVTTLPILEVAGLKIDPSRSQATYHDQPLKLTPKEYGLLELFLRNPTRLFSRDQIIDHLWTFDDLPSDESVKAHIKGLRQKLKRVGAIDWIENLYGMGYRLNPEVIDRPASASISTDSPQSDHPDSVKPQAPVEPSSKPSSEQPSSKPSAEQQFNQAAAGLWQQYQEVMRQRLNILQTAATTHPLPSDLRQSATQAAHKLAGVLGVFGKEAGTTLARSIEQLLDEDSSDLQSFPLLVSQLEQVLDLPAVSTTENVSVPVQVVARSSPPQLVLLDINPQLETALKPLLSSITGLQFQSCATVEAVQFWLKQNSADLLILNLDRETEWQSRLALMAELSARTPATASIVLTNTTALIDRVAIVRSGGQRILPHLATASQLGEAATQLLQQRLTEQTKVLAVDDDPVFLATLPTLLKPWSIRLTQLVNPTEFWQVLESEVPDLLILDVEMPDFNGIELCQAVRADARWQNLPILFVTARRDRNTIQQIFAAGADDYITKPLVGSELVVRVTNRLDRLRLMQSFSTKDPSTGLMHQAHSQQILEKLIEQAKQNQSCFSFVTLMIVDLDTINVQHSHQIGNQVLQYWGRLLQFNLRSAEVLSYWGNGEFVIALPGLGKAETEVYLEEVLTLLRQQIFTNLTGDRFQVNFCWEIAEYPTQGRTVLALYQSSRRSTHVI